jgi:hypothetical protein
MLAVSAYVFVYRAIGRPKSTSALWYGRRNDRLLDERFVEHVQPALLGERAGQPGPVYHGAQFDDGSFARDGLGGLFATTLRGLVIIGLGSLFFGCSTSCQLSAAFRGLHPGDGRPVRDGHDGSFAVPAAQPGGLAYLQPGSRAHLPGFGLLLPHRKPELLGRRRRLDHPAHPGAGCHAPAGFPSGPALGFLGSGRDRHPGGLCVVFPVGAKLLLDYMERLAIREGRLTESRR